MTQFFIRTDSSTSGPFTGVEVREAALAGILSPESQLSATQRGPWVDAAKAGLFSESRLPLPHPPGVRVPQFHVRGMTGASQGPFKLRELIGFAARGMLPCDSLFLSGPNQQWIPMDRLRILLACVTGELTMLNSQGQVVLRAVKPGTAPLDVASLRSPMTVAGRAIRSEPETYENLSWEPKPIASVASVSRSSESPRPTDDSAQSTESANSSGPILGRRFSEALLQALTSAPRALLQDSRSLQRVGATAAVGLLFAATAYGVSYWQHIPVRKQAIVGDWIGGMGPDGVASEHAFGLKFRENGECVFFNPTGSSWSGDYDWVERREDASGHARTQSLHIIVDSPEPNHAVEEILATDGYLRLTGMGDSKPRLDGHAVSDLFVRQDGNTLRLGYLTEVIASGQGKTMKAAWVEVTGAEAMRSTPTAEAKLAVTAESLAATAPAEMLFVFGVPDEARELYPFEARRENLRDDEMDATAIRYGEQRLIIRDQPQSLGTN